MEENVGEKMIRVIAACVSAFASLLVGGSLVYSGEIETGSIVSLATSQVIPGGNMIKHKAKLGEIIWLKKLFKQNLTFNLDFAIWVPNWDASGQPIHFDYDLNNFLRVKQCLKMSNSVHFCHFGSHLVVFKCFWQQLNK